MTEFEQALMVAYGNTGERAILKSVPITELSTVKGIFKSQGTPIRIRYRGPRHDGMRLTTLKRDAVRFSVYPQ